MNPTRFLLGPLVLLASVFLLSACGARRNNQITADADVHPEVIQSPAERRQEIDEKVVRIVALLKATGDSCAELSSPADIAWITGGLQPAEVLFGLRGHATLEVIVTTDGRRVALGVGPQLRRLEKEELGGLGFEFSAVESMAPEALAAEVERTRAMSCGGKPNPHFSSTGGFENSAFRSPLTPGEVHKYRWLGRACAETVEKVASTFPRFATEKGVEVLLADGLRRRDIEAVGIRVSADDRLREYGLVKPGSSRKIERAVAIGLTARRWGLHVSLARIVSLGPVDERLAQDLKNATALIAGLWARTTPGAALREAWLFAATFHESLGNPDLFGRHPIGWTTGYRESESLVERDTTARAQPGQPLVWSAAVGSAELTDTVMLIGDSFELLTATPDWPCAEARCLGRIYRVPTILIRQPGPTAN